MNYLDGFGKDAALRMEAMINNIRLNEFLKKKDEECKCKKTILLVFAAIGAIAAVAAISYAVYRFMAPDYLDEDDEEFEEDFDEDDIFEDEAPATEN